MVISRSLVILTKAGYKNTIMGEIPEDWALKNLGDNEVSLIKMGQSPPSNTYNKVGDGLPFLQGNAEFGFKYPSFTIYCSLPLKTTQPGDILISVRAPVGDVNIANSEYCIGRGLAAIRPNSKNTVSLFLYYTLNHSKVVLERISTGSTFKAIGKEQLYGLKIPFPKIKEQQKIAEILSAADGAIQKVNEQITLTEQLKNGLMQKLLTRGIGHTRFRETEIGEIPEDWSSLELNEVAQRFVSGGTPSTKNKGYWNGHIHWTRGANLTNHYLTNGEKTITDEGLKYSSSNIVKSGNLLVATRVSVGNVSINQIDIAISQDVTGIILDKTRMTEDFLYWYFKYTKDTITAYNRGSTIKGITRNDFQKLKITVPPISEQNKIADMLNTAELKNKFLSEKMVQLTKLKNSLMNDLLTGKVRVKV